MKNAENVMTFIFVLFCMLMISACGEKTSSTITLNPDFGNEADVSGAKLTMTNNSGKKSHIYKQTANGADVLFNKIVPGIYTLTVEHNDYFAFSVDNITVNNTVSGFTANLIRKGTAGGFIFFDKGSVSDGWRFLEVAPASSEFNAEWGCYTENINYGWRGIDVSGTQTGVGTGKENTQLINSMLQQSGETGRASQLCVALNIGGKNDWFLPSKDELNLMYQYFPKNGLGDFPNEWYWSSSQYGTDFGSAWGQSFLSGSQNSGNKDNTSRVRAIRAF